ncbi:MAG: cupin domain-containing protein [Betaproteobacteria bacterium]|nr:cupin domain-containing protein [Betaproteobacteria bacterium]
MLLNRVLAAVLAAALSSSTIAHEGDAGSEELKIVPKLVTDLPDLPGRESMMLTVEFPPGHTSEPHRHEAHTFVYVLEGTVEMQVAGGELKRLRRGDVFYENPEDVHTVARNPSKSRPAKILVLLLKAKGAAPVLPAEKN